MKTGHGSYGEETRIGLSASKAETVSTLTESSSDDGEDGCVKEQNGTRKISEYSIRVRSQKIESEDENDQTSWQFAETSGKDSTSDTPSADLTTLPHTTAKTQTSCDVFNLTNSVEKTYDPLVTATPLIKPQKENETGKLVSSQEEPPSPEESVEFREEEPSDAHLNSKQDISGKTAG